MRSIEEQIGVTENAKKAFREEILIRISSLARRGPELRLHQPRAAEGGDREEAVRRPADVVKITTSTKTPDAGAAAEDQRGGRPAGAEQGYCPVCANELLQYVGYAAQSVAVRVRSRNVECCERHPALRTRDRPRTGLTSD